MVSSYGLTTQQLSCFGVRDLEKFEKLANGGEPAIQKYATQSSASIAKTKKAFSEFSKSCETLQQTYVGLQAGDFDFDPSQGQLIQLRVGQAQKVRPENAIGSLLYQEIQKCRVNVVSLSEESEQIECHLMRIFLRTFGEKHSVCEGLANLQAFADKIVRICIDKETEVAEAERVRKEEDEQAKRAFDEAFEEAFLQQQSARQKLEADLKLFEQLFNSQLRAEVNEFLRRTERQSELQVDLTPAPTPPSPSNSSPKDPKVVPVQQDPAPETPPTPVQPVVAQQPASTPPVAPPANSGGRWRQVLANIWSAICAPFKAIARLCRCC